jgi:ParB/RepB/Spo0J family partition protein
LKTVPLDKIRIPEVRVSSILNEEQKALMTSTIREIGVIQDIVVREVGEGEYELVAGKSRLEELKTLGFEETQVKVIPADEKLGLIMNIIENVARGQFDYLSIARTIRKLREMGVSPEELERIFPWRRRWIQFIEDLQDLPDDVTEALTSRRITPTHVQLALNLPTPYEVHDGLSTAIDLGWDTGTFKTFVQNRVEQIERAKRRAAAQGVEPRIPPAVPEQLIRYKQCLLCGYKKPANQVTVQLVCDGCRDLAKYITDQEGAPEDAIHTVYAALQAYHGQRPSPRIATSQTTAGPPTAAVQKPPPSRVGPAPTETSVKVFQVLQLYRTGKITEDMARGWLHGLGLSAVDVEKGINRVKSGVSPT